MRKLLTAARLVQIVSGTWSFIIKLWRYAVNNPVSFVFNALFFFVPLVLFPKTSELFEFNKMVLTYGLTTLIISSWLTKMILRRKIIFRRTILDIPLLIFLTAQLLSTLVSFDLRTSVLGYYSRFHGGLMSSLSYALLYWAYVSNMNKKKTIKTIYFFTASAILVSAYGILEHFGIDKDIWVQDVQNRVFSTLGQPNWLAAWLVAFIPITWVLALKKGRRFWLWTGLSTLFFLTLLYTKSRSGILGFTTAYLIFWLAIFWLKRYRPKILLKPLLIITSILLSIAFLVGTPWTPSIPELFSRLTTKKPEVPAKPEKSQGPALEVGGTESGQIRKIVWKGAVDIWRHYPILGTGVETFAYSYYNFRPVEHNLVSEWDFLYNKAHNEYLNLAATTGSLGLASYLALVGTTIFLFLRKMKKSIWVIGFLSGYLSILVTNFFGFSVVPVALQFFLYPAMAVALVTREKKKVTRDSIELRSLASDQKILVTILFLVTFYLLVALGRYWYADVLYIRGKFENDRGNYQTARKTLQKAVNLSSKEAIYWDELSQSATGLALALYESGDEELANDFAEKAVIESDRAISLSPKNVNLLRSRGTSFIKLSALDPVYLFSAKEVVASAIKLAPTDAKLYYNLGLTYARIGEIDSAIEVLEETVNMKSNYRNARLALGLLYADRGEIKKAKQELNFILENIDPEDELVRQQLEEL